LWENIARKEPALGTPSVFTNDMEKSKWTSFSITFRDRFFIDQLQLLTGKETGTEGAITITDSNWLLSFAMTPYPYFKNQPEHVSVCWGYGLFPEEIGNYVKKKMTECTGREILTELCFHLGLQLHVDRIVETSTCIPCLMPYITSQFLPRTRKDRPSVVTREISNLALLGQYCEIPDDITFTLEYSVRAAQTGVYALLHLEKEVSPVYRGYRNPRHIFSTVKTVMTPKVSGELSLSIGKRLSRAALALIGLAGDFYDVIVNTFRNVRMGTSVPGTPRPTTKQ
jgi:oleate hydratase